MKALVTGGAGFIGSWTADLLLEKGHEVRILDSLQPRVHPRGAPPWLPEQAEFRRGDVTERADLEAALEGVDVVFHLAAYQDYLPDFSRFIRTNTESTALIFELIVADRRRFPVQKIVFASSQAVCGDGLYWCSGSDAVIDAARLKSGRALAAGDVPGDAGGHGLFTPQPRSLQQLQRGDWEIRCPACARQAEPVLIGEETANPGTAYGISKLAIELLADRLGRRCEVPTVCMRYTYVQGPRNSFYNAYSGIARRFALRLMHDLPPVIYEDGGQLRDYINVRDVARANAMVMEDPRADFEVFNVGGGRAITVREFARILIDEFDSPLEPEISGEFRIGDTRHTVSDISRLSALGWEPTIPVEQSMSEYVGWMRGQKGTIEYLEEAERVMSELGVVLAARPEGS